MPVLLIKIKTAFNWETMASAALHRRQLLKVLAGAAARPLCSSLGFAEESHKGNELREAPRTTKPDEEQRLVPRGVIRNLKRPANDNGRCPRRPSARLAGAAPGARACLRRN